MMSAKDVGLTVLARPLRRVARTVRPAIGPQVFRPTTD
jgi:hypothetical protein